MNANNELREQMWELCYDLLPADEKAALIKRIKSDPQAARLYADVRLQADLVGYASKVEDSSIVLPPAGIDGKTSVTGPAAGRSKAAAEASRDPARVVASYRWSNWLVTSAALLLAALIGYGYFRPMQNSQQIAHATITEVEAPSRLQPGLTQDISIRTSAPGSRAVAAKLNVSVIDPEGRERFRQVVETGEKGQANVTLPGEAVEAGARLQVALEDQVAGRKDFDHLTDGATPSQTIAVETELPVAAPAPVEYFLYHQPTADSRTEAAYSKLTLSPFSYEPVEMHTGETLEQASEESRLLAAEKKKSELERLPRDAREEIEKKMAALAGEPSPAPQPLDDQSSAEQLALRQSIRNNVAQNDVREPETRAKQSAGAAMAARADRQESFDRKLDEPAPEGRITGRAQASARKAEGLAERDLAKDFAGDETRGLSVISAGKSIDVDIPAGTTAGDLVAIAMKHNVVVAREKVQAGQTLGEKQGEVQRGKSISLDLPPEVEGEVEVALVDASQHPPRVITQQKYYRESARRIDIEISGLESSYQPGDEVNLNLQLRDETGAPVAANVAVRVFNDQLVREQGEEPVLLADAVRQQFFGQRYWYANESDKRGAGVALKETEQQLGGLANLDRMAKNAPLAAALPQPEADIAPGERPAEPALPSVGGGMAGAGGGAAAAAGGFDPAPVDTLGVPDRAAAHTDYFVSREELLGGPLLIATNRAEIEQEHRAKTAATERETKAIQLFVGRVLVGGGIAVLIVLGLLALARAPARWTSMTLAMATAAASLVIGTVWTGGHRQQLQIAAVPERTQATATAPSAEGKNLGYADDTQQPTAVDESAPASSTSGALSPDEGAVAQRFYERSAEGPAPQSGAAEAMFRQGGNREPDVVLKEKAEKLGSRSSADAFGAAGIAPSDSPTAPAGGAGRGVREAPAPRFNMPAPAATTPPAADLSPQAPAAPKAVAPDTDADVAADNRAARLMKRSDAAGAPPSSEIPEVEAAVADAPRPPANVRTRRGAPSSMGGGRGGFGQPADGVESLDADAAKPAKDGRLAERVKSEPAADPESNKAGLIDSKAAKEGEDVSGGQLGDKQQGTRGAPRQSGAAKSALGVDDKELFAREGQVAAPASLLFEPQRKADEQGRVTINFRLEPVAVDYRVLIDAYGQGRVGSKEVLIRVRPESP